MTEPERFMVMAFTEHHEPYRTLPEWPQHVTMLPWMEGYRLAATNRITDSAASLPPLEMDIAGVEMLGTDTDVPAWMIEPSCLVMRAHRRLLATAGLHGTRFVDDRGQTGDNYRPHITQWQGQPLRDVGERIVVSELSVVGTHAVAGKMVFKNIVLGIS